MLFWLWALPTDHSWQMHLCNIEEQQTNQNKMPQQNAPWFNLFHPWINFTMELEDNGKCPLSWNGGDSNVKPNDTGLLLHYQSHVDVKYEHSLLKAMLLTPGVRNSLWIDSFSIMNMNVSFVRLHFTTLSDALLEWRLPRVRVHKNEMFPSELPHPISECGKTPTRWFSSKARCCCPVCLQKSENQKTFQTKGA